MTLLFVGVLLYFVMPLVWLVISSTKSNAGLFDSFGFGLAEGEFQFIENIRAVFERDDGIFVVWMRNTFIYAFFGATGAAVVSLLAAYSFAIYRFPARNALAILIIATIMVPNTALAVPLFKVMRDIGIINTPLAMILPSMVSPFGVYLIWRFIEQAFPRELIDAAQVDGASELRTLWSVALPVISPAVATVFLFVFVATWNNFLLPLLVLTDTQMQPLTVGLAAWNAQTVNPVNVEPQYTVVITAALLSAIPLVLAFFIFQRYLRAGLTAGVGK
jgi:multiple sugar transport system permease protein